MPSPLRDVYVRLSSGSSPLAARDNDSPPNPAAPPPPQRLAFLPFAIPLAVGLVALCIMVLTSSESKISVMDAKSGETKSNDVSTPLPPRYLSSEEALLRLYTPQGHHPLAVLDLDPAGLAPFTHETQTIIYNHQHPASCEGKKFLVSLGHYKGNGIGSILHVTGYHLGVALELDRVFFFGNTSGEEWTDSHLCGPLQRNWECHFQAPTHCPRSLLTAPGADVIYLEFHYDTHNQVNSDAPPRFHPMLTPRFPAQDLRKYWWRGQSVTYLMRLNAPTIAAVRALRLDPGLLVFGGGVAGEAAPLPLLTPPTPTTPHGTLALPLPRGVIHAHVRHGDKYTEMELQGAGKYLNASHQLVLMQPQSLAKVLFVSSEDDGAIAELGALAVPWGGTVFSYAIPRSNAGPLEQVVNLGAERAAATTRTHLQQLLLSLECDAWVGTRGSNWNRLIDELKCTWVGKCSAPYVEVGTDVSWEHYNWRQ